MKFQLLPRKVFIIHTDYSFKEVHDLLDKAIVNAAENEEQDITTKKDLKHPFYGKLNEHTFRVTNRYVAPDLYDSNKHVSCLYKVNLKGTISEEQDETKVRVSVFMPASTRHCAVIFYLIMTVLLLVSVAGNVILGFSAASVLGIILVMLASSALILWNNMLFEKATDSIRESLKKTFK